MNQCLLLHKLIIFIINHEGSKLMSILNLFGAKTFCSNKYLLKLGSISYFSQPFDCQIILYFSQPFDCQIILYFSQPFDCQIIQIVYVFHSSVNPLTAKLFCISVNPLAAKLFRQFCVFCISVNPFTAKLYLCILYFSQPFDCQIIQIAFVNLVLRLTLSLPSGLRFNWCSQPLTAKPIQNIAVV